MKTGSEVRARLPVFGIRIGMRVIKGIADHRTFKGIMASINSIARVLAAKIAVAEEDAFCSGMLDILDHLCGWPYALRAD